MKYAFLQLLLLIFNDIITFKSQNTEGVLDLWNH